MRNKKVLKIVMIGIFAALVFVTSKFRFTFETGIGSTGIHLGNVMCLLSGLMLGGVNGGLAAGIGSMFFDLTDPAYIASAPFTLVFKFLMAYVCGKIAYGKQNEGYNLKVNIFAAILGSVTYIILHLTKSFISSLILGAAFQTALVGIGIKGVTSLINAIIAVAVSVPLALVLKNAFKKSNINIQ